MKQPQHRDEAPADALDALSRHGLGRLLAATAARNLAHTGRRPHASGARPAPRSR
ncbi:hypothetical protein [Streptomyces sp. NPDC046939]|uniref:hypothetical protein n=1 Tax=Streptomyces sp. NPDC046939 TaxID=3155376 RepID=UPI00340BBE98